ncbi:MAG TPA: hypothetical protein DDZ89_11380 [Clostridiales bacterium]|nr:hypothetical protein [Clostridiales bacterium]
MKRLEIVTLDSFSVKKDGENLSVKYKRSKKLWQLFHCLLANNCKIVGVDYLTECICSEDDNYNPKQVLQNLIYRLRKILDELNTDNEESVIVYEQDGYRCNTKNHYFDAQVFEELCHCGFKMGDDAINCFQKALALYKNKFLEENNNDRNIEKARTHYHDLYLKATDSLIHLYQLQGYYDDIIEVSKAALLVDYYDTNIHKEYLKAMLEKDQTRKALSHYEEATEKLYTQAGILPTAEMNAIYRSIKNRKKDSFVLLSDILKDLSAKFDTQGACLCDLETFVFIYNMVRKRNERYMKSYKKETDGLRNRYNMTYIMLMTVVPNDTPGNRSQPINAIMNQVTQVLLSLLRRTDITCQWSKNQFLILLFDLEMEHTDLVFNRIKNEYERTCPDAPVVLIKSINAI